MSLRLMILAGLFGLLAAACRLELGGGGSPFPDGGLGDGGLPDAGDDDGRFLVLATEASLVLPYGSSAEVVVRHFSTNGAPIVGETVRFTMHGRANDSSLSAFTSTTDADGKASVKIHSGLVESTFTVRVAVEGLEPVYVAVTVSVGPLGTLTVVPVTTLPSIARYRVQVYRDATCDAERIAAREYDRTSTIWEADGEAPIPILPVTGEYAVTVEALDSGVLPLALRCVDAVTVEEAGSRLEVELDEHRVETAGEYHTTLTIELGDDPAGWAQAMHAHLDAVFEETGEAERFLSALANELIARGDVDGHNALMASFAEIASLLADELVDEGPSAGIRRLVTSLESLRSFVSEGRLVVEGFSLDPAERQFTETSRAFVSDEETLAIPAEGFRAFATFVSPIRASFRIETEAPLSSLVRSALVARTAGQDGDLGAALGERASCPALAAHPAFAQLGSDCDAACLESLCQTFALTLFDGAIDALDGPDAEPDVAFDGLLGFGGASFESRDATQLEALHIDARFPGASSSLLGTFVGVRAQP